MAAVWPDAFMGTWYIAHSTLEVWKQKGRQNCRIVSTKEASNTWSDVSTFEEVDKHGHIITKTIRSWNHQSKDDPKGFTWNIRGLLFWVRCKCKVICHDDVMQDYAVVLFGSSLVSKPGVDVYSRTNQDLPADKLAAIIAEARSLDPAVGQVLDSQELVAVKKTPGSTTMAADAAGTAEAPGQANGHAAAPGAAI